MPDPINHPSRRPGAIGDAASAEATTGIDDAKRALRREMRAIRRALPDRAERSARLWRHVRARPEVARATVVMVFDSVPGEPITAPFIEWCRAEGKQVIVPDADPAAHPPDDPSRVDVVIVPGLAFSLAGDRLGQGGGWYDRFLARTRHDCTTIGVGFEPQVVAELPIEPHDVRVDLVITDATPFQEVSDTT
ncbi:MAG: 5-formyltetrahydrofolate cyclo-ligase [Ilumatobacter sp.]|uniref:5-formyltetrahydrofolate cyclo-ligase n=1 Tax=Ilumatobacter sp. TaxID=1967498 RepID=UPI002602BF3C|nr:5-formyltetrahydrofolate cyclo-ligase [Ilumatobacter sp.]MDJ0769945.1 5-formyltetrahydrofolate cyclo-ligase [Ilumatobacter sp.]